VDCFDDQTIARLIAPGTEPPPGFDRHLDECDACRELVMATARGTAGALHQATPKPGHHVGRYLLLQRLGAGGSGVVYSAYDPELQREVAVKLVAASADPSHNARLLEEARTMARLTDPHVVRVYDAGTIGDSVFLAMELMSGGTLRDWQRVGRPWTLVLDRYLEAGRGLAAAHECGLVHRDFKPSNVLLSQGGRACVGDFGLASSGMTTVSESGDGESLVRVDSKPPKIAGTPLYMSPEAHRGDTIDRRSDQYSFCVALFEALYAYLPYPGTSLRAVEEAKNAGRIASGPRRGPRGLFRALERGLRPDPTARFAGMPELLDALRRVQRRRRSIASVAVVTAAAIVGAMAYGLAIAEREPACVEAAGGIAETWNADIAGRLEQRASTLDRAAAHDVVRHAIARLDGYAQSWSESSVATCRAAHLGALTEDAHQRRIACLEQSAAAMGGLVHELETLDASMLPTIGAAAASLPDVEACDEPDASTPIAAESIAALGALRAARAAVNVGRVEPARSEIERILSEAVAREDLWVASQAGHESCSVAIRLDPPEVAVARCEQAAAHAIRSGDLGVAAVAWSTVSGAEAQNLGRREIGKRFDLLADAAAQVVDDPAVFAMLAESRAQSLQTTDAPAALEQARLALEWEIEARGPDHPSVTNRKLALVGNLGQMGHHDEAVALVREARASVQAANGADDPAVAQAWAIEGKLHAVAMDGPQAIAAYEHAIEGFTRMFGADNSRTLYARVELAFARATAEPRSTSDMIAELDIVLPKLRALSSEPNPFLPPFEAHRALLLQRVGRSDEAVTACQSALEAARALGSPDSAVMVTPHHSCGEIHFHRTELDEALAHWEAALAVAEKVNGPEHPFCIDLARMIDDRRMEWNKPPRR
jgi:serine/threonine protein kinase/tetratricopeptide (TPR) repeat protein